MTRAKILGLAGFFAAGLIATTARAQDTPADPATPAQVPPPATAPAVVADDEMMDFSNLTDAQFIQKAVTSGLMEVVLSKLADGEAPTEAVQEFATQMIEDHNAANKKLVALAEEKDIDYKNTLDEANKAKYDRFADMEGAALESEYLSEQLKSHKEAVALFTAMSTDADDADIRAFATETLPTLKSHLEKVQALTGEETPTTTATPTTVSPRVPK